MNVLAFRTVKNPPATTIVDAMLKSLDHAQWMETLVFSLFGLEEHKLLSLRPRDLDKDVPCVAATNAG